MKLFLVLIIGSLGGLAGALQGQSVGIMEEKAGTLVSTFVTYGGGGLMIAIAMLVSRGARLSDLKGAPWWIYTAGFMGLVVVASLGITVSQLGLGAGLTLFTAASITLGALLEATGLFGEGQTLDLRRVAGIVIVVVGTWLVVGTDRVMG